MKEGFRGFFKGVLSPLVSRTPVSSALYFSQGYAYRKIDTHSQFGSVAKQSLAGAFAGFVFANVAFPFDLMKVKKQANLKRIQTGYLEELTQIYKAEGMKGFTRGYTGLLIRDVPGFAIYFGSFEANKKFLGVHETGKYGELTASEVAFRKFISGGFAGVITWTIAFPADTIKTKI
jgi:solute carrier family 25 carnitine/acylcarnitine transporter 20/29